MPEESVASATAVAPPSAPWLAGRLGLEIVAMAAIFAAAGAWPGDRDQERFEAGHGEGFSGLLKTWSEDRGGHFALDAGVAAGWIAVPTSSQTRS